jgi:hypothetical protein
MKKKKSYHFECLLSVDSHWPVFEFQSLTLLSRLPLDIFVPSGLHATQRTLRYDEMSQHTKQLRQGKKIKHKKKKSYKSECPLTEQVGLAL